MKLFVGLILFSNGIFANETADGEAVVETVDETSPPSDNAEHGGVQAPVSEDGGKTRKVTTERIYTEEEKKQMRQLMREREEYNRQVRILA